MSDYKVTVNSQNPIVKVTTLTSTLTGLLQGTTGPIGATGASGLTGTTGPIGATGVSPTIQIPTTVATSTYTMTSTDSTLIFTGGHCTVTLLSAATYPGRIIYITNAASGTVISATSNVVPGGSVTAGTALLSNAAGHFACIQSNGTNWITIMSGSGN